MGVLANTRSPMRVCQFRLPAGVLWEDSSSRGRFVKEHNPLKISPLPCAASAATVRGRSANAGLDCWCARPCGELSDRFSRPSRLLPPLSHAFGFLKFLKSTTLFPVSVLIHSKMLPPVEGLDDDVFPREEQGKGGRDNMLVMWDMACRPFHSEVTTGVIMTSDL